MCIHGQYQWFLYLCGIPLDSTGLDLISVRLLRECADLTALSFCSIFNRCIFSGVFPDDWKCSKVIPQT